MTLKVLFFASVRERLGCTGLDVDLAQTGGDLDGLQAHLYSLGDDSWREVLGQDNIIRAVNHEVVEGNRELVDGDEVAYFPPVTGG